MIIDSERNDECISFTMVCVCVFIFYVYTISSRNYSDRQDQKRFLGKLHLDCTLRWSFFESYLLEELQKKNDKDSEEYGKMYGTTLFCQNCLFFVKFILYVLISIKYLDVFNINRITIMAV